MVLYLSRHIKVCNVYACDKNASSFSTDVISSALIFVSKIKQLMVSFWALLDIFNRVFSFYWQIEMVVYFYAMKILRSYVKCRKRKKCIQIQRRGFEPWLSFQRSYQKILSKNTNLNPPKKNTYRKRNRERERYGSANENL